VEEPVSKCTALVKYFDEIKEPRLKHVKLPVCGRWQKHFDILLQSGSQQQQQLGGVVFCVGSLDSSRANPTPHAVSVRLRLQRL